MEKSSTSAYKKYPFNGTVAVVKCSTYGRQDVEEAVGKAIELLGGFDMIFSKSGKNLSKKSSLVLKPNLLARTSPDKACTTHPSVFRAVGSLLKKEGYDNLKYGDSPGNPMVKVEKVAEDCGIKAVADDLCIPLGRFESGTQVEYPRGRVANKFVICDEVLEADGIINICKMKTHQLERITGAVKNTFGCVYGVNKGASHAKFATAEVFAKMLADLNNMVKPVLHIMDGIVAMEGNGPQSGTPKQMNLIIASSDPVALDSVFCHLVNLKPERVPTNVSGMEQGVGTWKNLTIIDEDGELSIKDAAIKYGDNTFDVQRDAEYRGKLKPIRFLAPLLEKKPVVDKDKCVGCGICVTACPIEEKAIYIKELNDGSGAVAVYDYRKCIKCYCCQEMCPREAIDVKKSLLARLADRNWRI